MRRIDTLKGNFDGGAAERFRFPNVHTCENVLYQCSGDIPGRQLEIRLSFAL